MSHTTSVPWADESIELSEEQLRDWVCRTESLDDAKWIQYAEGPCPSCRATVEGYTTNQPGPLEAELTEAEDAEPIIRVKVPVECNCGYAHGEKDATGCGRDWVVICEIALKDIP